MTIKGNPWNHLINKPLTNLFIHDSSGLYAFPQASSPTDTSSSKFNPMDTQFLDLVPNTS